MPRKKINKTIQVIPKSRFPQHRPTIAMQGLSPEQIIFAQWLATSTFIRQPKTQKELAIQLGVNEETIKNWKNMPEIWQVVDEHLGASGRELVPNAISVLNDLLNDKDHKALELKAAIDVLDRWSDPRKHAGIIGSIKDLWDIHKEVLEQEKIKAVVIVDCKETPV